jgi:UDP-glucuronate decarboxylase
MTKRVLVAGGAGFLGSHLCDRLLAEGMEVVCFDNLSSGRLRNLDHLGNEARFSFVAHDVRVPWGGSERFDWIFNLACPASPPGYQADPAGTMLTSVLGAFHLLELARGTRARVLQASTSEIYGDPEISPQPDGYRGCVSTTGPRACYDEGKRAAETLFFDFRRHHAVDVRVARIFNTYGPRMSAGDGRVVSNFLSQALRGEPLTLYGNGRQTRSFCYVSDLIDGLFRLMATDRPIETPINLGNPEEITMLELALRVQAVSERPIVLEHRDLPIDDPARRQPDIAEARRLLDWSPSVGLEAGLRRTMASLRDELRDERRVRPRSRPAGRAVEQARQAVCPS